MKDKRVIETVYLRHFPNKKELMEWIDSDQSLDEFNEFMQNQHDKHEEGRGEYEIYPEKGDIFNPTSTPLEELDDQRFRVQQSEFVKLKW